MIAGLEDVTSGRISIDGQDATQDGPGTEAGDAIDRAERTGVFALGAIGVEPFLRDYVAAGIDEAMRIWDTELEADDDLKHARIAAAAIRRWSADVVVTGGRLGEVGANVLGPMIAELLGIPQVTGAVRIAAEADQLVVHRRADGFVETVRCPTPAVVAVDRGRPLPYPTLPNRLRARAIAIEEPLLGSFEVNFGQPPQSHLEVVSVSTPKPQRKALLDSRPALDRTVAQRARFHPPAADEVVCRDHLGDDVGPGYRGQTVR